MDIKVKIEAFDHFGRGIAHYNGKVIFISNALPTEEVLIKITKESKKYSEAVVTKYLIKAKSRIDVKCPYYNKCGGCSLSNMNYDDQIKYKQDKLQNILYKYAKTNPKIETIKSDIEYNYRNKIELKVINNKWGYYNSASHDFIEVDKCLLAKDSINKVIENKDLLKINDGEIIIKSNYNDEILIKIISSDKCNVDVLKLKEQIKLIGILINDKLFYGERNYVELINNYYFKVDINSFFQVNLNILSKVFDILKQNKFNNVVDLYCGVGTLGIAVNSDVTYGIEIVPEAVMNAITNAKINHKHNEYLLGDSSNITKIDHKIDAIIMDPPRTGIDSKSIDYILKSNIQNIIYMSCDPLTLTRDLNILKDTYDIVKCYLFDMFPQTYHVETIVVLKLKDK
jgi:23S rRNA (uracil1939-C5)-methyltransferase